ncbi:MAG: pyridoxamine 5'-phosphate oxidase family protein [Methanosarcina barkeri]|nr:pyridoxamine 5'-phosphate oxidase family protein [Methanosarcina sp. ERenArc_MAG2]
MSYKLEEKEDENPVKSRGLEKKKLPEKLRQFIESQPFAVLITQKGIAPYVSPVAFVSNEKAHLSSFSITKATRKYSYLMAHPEVYLLIDNWKNKIKDFRDIMAVAAIGRAAHMGNFERSIIEKFYLMKYPYLVDFLHFPTTDLKSG